MHNCVLIFSGFNRRAVISFIRTLERNNVIYAIIAASEEDTILNSAYKDKVYAIRKKIQLDFDDLIQTIEKVKERIHTDEFFVAPSTEALNRFFLRYRNSFEEKGIIIPLVEKNLYEQISDKYTFGKLCQKHSILTPREETTFGKIEIPFVAKPYTYFNKKGQVYVPQLIISKKDKKDFIENFDLNDFYYQQYILGKSFYLLYYVDKNAKIYKYSQENIAQQPNGKSIVAAVSSSIHNEYISNKYEQLLFSVRFRGLIMIEIKEEAGEYYMIEANPRFWGPSQLFVDSGINFFELLLWDYGIIEKCPKFKIENKKYFWYGGIIETVKKEQNLTLYADNFHIHDEEALKEWLENDIYKRDDTNLIFENEILEK